MRPAVAHPTQLKAFLEKRRQREEAFRAGETLESLNAGILENISHFINDGIELVPS